MKVNQIFSGISQLMFITSADTLCRCSLSACASLNEAVSGPWNALNALCGATPAAPRLHADDNVL